MTEMKKRISITKDAKDYLRIIPKHESDKKAGIKFSFIDKNFVVRSFSEDEKGNLLRLVYNDFGLAEHELTYHSSNSQNQNPTLLPKSKSKNTIPRQPITNEIIDLCISNLILPIPICRITINKETNKTYKLKKEHLNINLGNQHNTTEIYIASKKYNFEEMSKRWPMLVGSLFPIITIDFLLYGAGFSVEPIMNKMFSQSTPIAAMKATEVNDYLIFYKTYELIKSDKFRLYSTNKEYDKSNIIEFFNNIDYLDLLATTKVGFKAPTNNKWNLKYAFECDIQTLIKRGFSPNYINKWNKRFSNKANLYKSMKFFRSGILFDI